eukprot:TRINITY_DN14287_c0_g1_i1.p1 TRINITY_DN14287_c0_g1~~TRINITY_DN14287_c0_g1_i1.p1  ORF type:complete len:224 (+),score=34.12 TRINITY_DN14287_c0_g1_i1:38-673(+)
MGAKRLKGQAKASGSTGSPAVSAKSRKSRSPQTGSIYAPKGSDRQLAHVKQQLTWVDNVEKSKAPLTKVHRYEAPWSRNPKNWWAQGMANQLTIPINITIAPGKAHAFYVQRPLRQELHLRSAYSYTDDSFDPSAARKKSSKVKRSSLYLMTVEEVEGKKRATQSHLSSLADGESAKLGIGLCPGKYYLSNEGDMDVTVHGILRTMHLPMV